MLPRLLQVNKAPHDGIPQRMTAVEFGDVLLQSVPNNVLKRTAIQRKQELSASARITAEYFFVRNALLATFEVAAFANLQLHAQVCSRTPCRKSC